MKKHETQMSPEFLRTVLANGGLISFRYKFRYDIVLQPLFICFPATCSLLNNWSRVVINQSAQEWRKINALTLLNSTQAPNVKRVSLSAALSHSETRLSSNNFIFLRPSSVYFCRLDIPEGCFQRYTLTHFFSDKSMLHEFLKSLQSQIVPRRHIIINSSEKLTVFIYQMLIFNENNRYFRFQSLLILMIKETGKIIPQYFNYTFMYIARRIVVISISMFCNSKISIVLQRSSKFYI